MHDVAIFWDYENVKVVAQGVNVPMAESLIAYAESVGHPRVKKVYCNWRAIGDAITQALYSLGFDLIQISMGKPNSVDLKLAVDCLDIAQNTPSIKYFIIVTGDKDYIPVISWLQEQRKEVIVIGRPDVVSEHLLLSANKFISLEELSKMVLTRAFSKTAAIETKLLTFEEGIDCLLEAVSAVRDQGKTTLFPLIDTFMRSSQKYDYRGAKHSIQRPNGPGTFSAFGEFITAAEQTGKIRTHTSEGFKEIFLPEEDPSTESEFSPLPADKIDAENWEEIIKIIENDYLPVKNEIDSDESPFMHLFNSLRRARNADTIQYSNKTLKEALEKLIAIGFLIKTPKGFFKLAEGYKENLHTFFEKLRE